MLSWLINRAPGARANLGRVEPDASGAASVKYADPAQANLLAAYDKVALTREDLELVLAAPATDVARRGQLPPPALVHIRHLLVSFPLAPKQTALEVGLRSQINLVLVPAGYLRDAQQAGSLAGVRLHAEHLVNIIAGSKGAHYGDLNAYNGVPTPNNGPILPVAGSGGALTSYAPAQAMAAVTSEAGGR